jgi:hypothetical protein
MGHLILHAPLVGAGVVVYLVFGVSPLSSVLSSDFTGGDSKIPVSIKRRSVMFVTGTA